MNYKGHTKKQLLEIYRLMYLSRRLDEKQLIMLKQGKGFFHIGASGHEAVEIAAAKSLKPSYDYAYPYYRDQAFCLGLGMTSQEIMLSFLAKENDPNSGGRQMPQHYGHKELNIVSQSSPTGTQYLQAVGAAFALQRNGDGGISYVSSGEGTTSQGDFHEALNWASREKAPVIFHIENNNYAISVPINEQISGESVFDITAGYDSLMRFNINGCDYFESILAFEKAFKRTRNGMGPSLIVSNVVRLLPHSSSDDDKKYKTDKEIDSDRKKDPLKIFSKACIDKYGLKKDDLKKIEDDIDKEIASDLDWALEQEDPSPESYSENLFSNSWVVKNTSPNYISEKTVLVDSINHALDEELCKNKKTYTSSTQKPYEGTSNKKISYQTYVFYNFLSN